MAEDLDRGGVSALLCLVSKRSVLHGGELMFGDG